jgi:hypothetical protein
MLVIHLDCLNHRYNGDYEKAMGLQARWYQRMVVWGGTKEAKEEPKLCRARLVVKSAEKGTTAGDR